MLSWSACLVESEAPSAGKPSGLGDEEHGDVLLVRTISDASTAGFSAATCAENEEAVLYGDEIIEVSSPGRRDAPFGQWPSSNGSPCVLHLSGEQDRAEEPQVPAPATAEEPECGDWFEDPLSDEFLPVFLSAEDGPMRGHEPGPGPGPGLEHEPGPGPGQCCGKARATEGKTRTAEGCTRCRFLPGVPAP
ncbi:unnamed protein product [Prorocentrum cordatum]|uniref:Uncharacterized protein n=1 Tax=Prorocentrum cordatum TaxID=2364126 RepID=A0ABN9P6I5_9DINO|nr:unnamed protein product [Polarella glacialis]